MDYGEIIEIKTAKERFLGNYDMFFKYLCQFPERSLFCDLREELDNGNIKKSFEIAHTMKGLVSNLSLKEMERTLFPIVEVLRAGKMPGESELEELKKSYDMTVACIEKLRQSSVKLF